MYRLQDIIFDLVPGTIHKDPKKNQKKFVKNKPIVFAKYFDERTAEIFS